MVAFLVGMELLVLGAVNELLFQHFLFQNISISYGCISSWCGVLVLGAVIELLFQYVLFQYISISYGCISSWCGLAYSGSC